MELPRDEPLSFKAAPKKPMTTSTHSTGISGLTFFLPDGAAGLTFAAGRTPGPGRALLKFREALGLGRGPDAFLWLETGRELGTPGRGPGRALPPGTKDCPQLGQARLLSGICLLHFGHSIISSPFYPYYYNSCPPGFGMQGALFRPYAPKIRRFSIAFPPPL